MYRAVGACDDVVIVLFVGRWGGWGSRYTDASTHCAGLQPAECHMSWWPAGHLHAAECTR